MSDYAPLMIFAVDENGRRYRGESGVEPVAWALQTSVSGVWAGATVLIEQRSRKLAVAMLDNAIRSLEEALVVG